MFAAGAQAQTTPDVSIVTTTAAVHEGGTASFNVQADPAPVATIVVNLNVQQTGDFVAAGDLDDKTVTIPGGTSSVTYTVQTVNDSVDEANGALQVVVRAGSGYNVGSPPNAQAAVVDNDDPSVSLSAASYSVTEGEAVSVTLNIVRPQTTTTAVGITCTNGTAGSADYSCPSSVTIPANAGTHIFTVQTTQDTVVEGHETFTVAIASTPSGIATGSPSSATVTVQNDDAAVSFRSNVATVYESEGSVRLPVELSAPRGEPTVVQFTDTAFSATGGSDYTSSPYSVTIPAGRRSATLDIGIVADDQEEVDEAFAVEIHMGTLPSGVTLGSPGTVTVTIADAPPPCTNCVWITGGPAVTEGSDAVFTVRAIPAPTTDVTVRLAVDDSPGVSFSDFLHGRDDGFKAVTILSGQTSAAYRVPTTNDDKDEQDGAVTVKIFELAGGGRNYRRDGPREASVTVRDDDAALSPHVPPAISVSTLYGEMSASRAVNEGELAYFCFVVEGGTVPATMPARFHVGYEVRSTDQALVRSGALQFFSGGTLKMCVDIRTDGQEGETWTARVMPGVEVRYRGRETRLYTVGTTSAATVTVLPRPQGGEAFDTLQGGATPLPVVTISADAASVTEGGDVTFTVTADPAPSYDLPVNVGVAQEIGATGNRVGSSGLHTVTIRAGRSSAAWTVTTLSDDVAGADGEAVGRVLSGYDYRLGARTKVAVALIDDDGGTADADDAPEPTSVTTQTGPQGVTIALVAEVKGHIAHFKARNHGAGVRDWTLVLDRLEGRTGMSDAAIAAWLARSRQYGWQDGIQTLPKVQSALAALAAAPRQQPATLPVVTIAAGASPVTEGGNAVFTLTASPLPASPLAVSVTVDASGDYGIAGASRTVTIPTAGSFTLTLATADDSADEPDGSVTVTVADGAGYTVGSSASGTVSVRDDDLPPPAVSITAAAASVTEGGAASFTVSADRAPDADLTITLSVSEAAGGDHVAADDEGTATVTIAKGATEASFSVATVDDAVDEPDGAVTVTVAAGAGYTVSSSRGAATVSVSDNDAAAGPVLSVADATVTEGDWAELMPFAVRLSAAAAKRVRVRASTRVSSPVSARPKEDYWPQSELVTFYPGETEKTVWVYIYNDSHDEDPETFEVVLSDADGATIGDGVAVGTIVNDDPMPAAWLARFGRTVAEQALDGIAGRMAAPRTPGMQGTLAGQALSFDASTSGNRTAAGSPAPGGTGSLALADVARSFDNRADRFGNGGFGSDPGSLSPGSLSGAGSAQSRGMTGRDALLGSSFSLTGETDGSGGSMAFWGRAAQGSFDGREGTFSLDGAVTTGMLGADYARGKWLVGLALAQSEGEGDYRDSDVSPRPDGQTCPDGGDGPLCGEAVRAGDGSVEASLTAAIPYAALQASERLKLWGAAGYGTGEVTLKTAMGGSYKADTSWSMAAAGLRGDLLEAPAEGSGPALAVTSDALWTRTSSEKTRDLAASDSDATRLRLGLEGSYRMALESGGHLTPKLEIGARHDGGDAETGFGVEIGGGIAWADPGLGLSLDVSGRTLIAHGNDDLKDRGYAASLAFDPDPATRRGPSLSLRQEFGGQAKGGLDALFQPAALEDRTGTEATSRWSMEATCGFPAFGGRWTGSPHAGLGLATGARDYSVGWRLAPETNAPDLSFGVKASRRETDTDAPEHTVGFEVRARW